MIDNNKPRIAALLLLATAPVAFPQHDATWMHASTLIASNADADDQLGAGGALMGPTLAISRDGSTLAVAAPHEDGAATGVDGDPTDNSAYAAGAVYIYTRSGQTWTQQAYLKASNAELGDNFGFALALSADGSTLAVSANFESSGATGIDGDQSDNSAETAGAVYVFTRADERWSQQAYIKASNADASDRFGFAVALSDDGATMAVGAIGEDSAATGIDGDPSDNSAEGAGAVYVFDRDGEAWTQQAYLKASNAEAGDLYGFCVALSADGDTLGVCAFDEDSAAEGIDGDQLDNRAGGSGAAYVLVRDGGTWRQQAYIKQSNTTLQSAFGTAIALSADGNTLVVTAGDEDGTEPGVGAPQWQVDRPAHERTRVTEGAAGALYVYSRRGSVWSFDEYIKSSNIRIFDTFGGRLALSASGELLVAGAQQQPGGGSGIAPPSSDASAPESGAAYVFVNDDGRWREEAYIKAADAAAYDLFGSGVAVSGDGRLLAVAASGADGPDDDRRDAGAVYLYTRSAPK